MSGAAAARPLPRDSDGGKFADVLAGVLLDGEAAQLAALVDPAFLAEAGWDPAHRVLSLPAGHALLGCGRCKAVGCPTMAYAGGVCRRCKTRLAAAGMTAEQIGSAEYLPSRAAQCVVPGCLREPGSSRATGLCRAHNRQYLQRTDKPALEEFLADPRVSPLGPSADCAVFACTRAGEEHQGSYCRSHYERWRAAVTADPGLDAGQWRESEQPATESGLVSLRGLPPLVVVQVLAGLQQRTRDGARTGDSCLRVLCRALASQGAASVTGFDAGAVPGAKARKLLRAVARYARLAVSDPGTEQAADVWDLAVFGHGGRLNFTGITQPWLRESAKQRAALDLPRRRGHGASHVGEAVMSAARLSESLRTRPDHGDDPAVLSRRDIENFLSRLAYLESAGKISRYQRNLTYRGARTVLTAIREQGLARPGQPAAGLPGDVAITRADIPALPERPEPGRDLPPEIMSALCAAMDTLRSGNLKIATQIAADTGRRPDEIASLPLDCLSRDARGAPPLNYNKNKKQKR